MPSGSLGPFRAMLALIGTLTLRFADRSAFGLLVAEGGLVVVALGLGIVGQNAQLCDIFEDLSGLLSHFLVPSLELFPVGCHCGFFGVALDCQYPIDFTQEGLRFESSSARACLLDGFLEEF